MKESKNELRQLSNLKKKKTKRKRKLITNIDIMNEITKT